MPDIEVINQGSVVGLLSHSEKGKEFIDELEAEDWQWIGAVLYVDHRCAEPLLAEASQRGLTIE